MGQNRPSPEIAQPMPSNGNNANDTVSNEAPPPVKTIANACRAGAAVAPLPVLGAIAHATNQQLTMLPHNNLPPPAAVKTVAAGTAIATSINAAKGNTPQTSTTTGGGGGRVSFADVGNNLPNDFPGMPTLEPNSNYIGIPTLPPLSATIDTAIAFNLNMPAGWTCECGATYPSNRKRCKCGKWRRGMRAPYERKKKSAGESSNESISATSGVSSTAREHPVVNEVNITTNNHSDFVSPMTATRDSGSVGGSTVSSISTVMAMEINEMIQQLISKERQERGDGGDSDEEGDGFDTMNDLGIAAVEANRERAMHDSDEIEDNIRDDVDNCIVSNVPRNITVSAANNAVPPLFGAPIHSQHRTRRASA